jgi:hypothetical protein
MDAILKAVPGLVTGLLGVVAAYIWYTGPGGRWLAPGALALLAIVGWVLHRVGVGRIRRGPVESIPLLEGWGLLVVAGAALGTAIGIVLAVNLANLTPQGAPAEQKELVTATIGALSGFVTASLVKGLEDIGALVAAKVKGDFEAAYNGCFPNASSTGTDDRITRGYRALYLDDDAASGWGFSARRDRAKVLAEVGC